MNTRELLEVDGSIGEGGGAILRLSAGFSLLYNVPIRIKKIRANRPKPGLRLQHLLGLKTLAELTGSSLSDCKVGTEEITFKPNSEAITPNLNVNINTSASIGLLLQPIQIACLGFTRPQEIEINLIGGGTFGKWAPSLNYLTNVTYPLFKKCGVTINIEIFKEGFYPKGGAHTRCKISLPKNKLKPINLTELGNVDLILGEIVITNQIHKSIGNRIKQTIIDIIGRNLNLETEITIKQVKSLSSGVGLCLWANSDTEAIISTGTILGEKHISSEKLGTRAADRMVNYINKKIPVDNYLSDNLIPLMSFIQSSSSMKVLEITNHTQTNLDIVKQFTNRNYHISKIKHAFLIKFD